MIKCHRINTKDEKMNLKQLRNTLLLVLAAFVWGTTFVAQSIGAEKIGTFTFLAARSYIAATALIPVVLVYGKVNPYRPKNEEERINGRRLLIRGGIICGLFFFAGSSLQQAGIAYTTTAKASFITTLYVIIVPLFGLLVGKKVGGKIWFCVALGVLGLYLLCMSEKLSLQKGDALVLLCAVLFSGHILVIDRFSPQTDGVRLSCIQFFTAAVIGTICMLIFEKPSWDSIMEAMPSLLYAGIFSGAIGFTLQIIAQQDLNPTVASLAMCLESVFGALAGWVVLGQTLTSRELIGCTLMFAAIVIAQLPIGKHNESV